MRYDLPLLLREPGQYWDEVRCAHTGRVEAEVGAFADDSLPDQATWSVKAIGWRDFAVTGGRDSSAAHPSRLVVLRG
jgi:hypothetical protein